MRFIWEKILPFIFMILVMMIQLQVGHAGDISVNLELFPEIQNARMLFFRDFDIMQLGRGPLLFRLTMLNRSSQPKRIIGKFSVTSESLGPLLIGETSPFVLEPGNTYLTNRDLFSSQSTYALTTYSFESASEELRTIVLQTGRLPADKYHFKWEIYDAENPLNNASETATLTIDNPTSLNLISPGAPGTFGHLPILFTPLPYFQWESNALKFQLTVCEAISAAPEESMHYDPRLQVVIENTTAFQYPLAATSAAAIVRPLEEGKTYYWQIIALIETSSGVIEIPSEIWGFTVGDLSSGILNANQRQLVANLRAILGDKAVDLLFGPDGELYGFEITGVAFLNGKPISLEIINKLIEDILSGKLEVKDMRVEDL